jgi:hypothetical protein
LTNGERSFIQVLDRPGASAGHLRAPGERRVWQPALRGYVLCDIIRPSSFVLRRIVKLDLDSAPKMW